MTEFNTNYSFGMWVTASCDHDCRERCLCFTTWGMVAQAGFQVAAHGTLGGVSTWARGGSFWSGFASGAAWRCIAKRNNINLYKR